MERLLLPCKGVVVSDCCRDDVVGSRVDLRLTLLTSKVGSLQVVDTKNSTHVIEVDEQRPTKAL